MSRGRKKKELPEPVLTNGLKDTNVVQKSKPLFSLWKSNLTLSEFKILDTYLSRINSNEPESRSVVFEKGELEKLLGVTKINRPELQKRLRHLQGTIVSVGEGKNIDEITLFERSQAVQDENGLWQIKLTASLSAMKYIFNIEKIGYFRYKIRAITKLRSLYSYTLFMYLEYNKYRRKWTENLEELKQILGCTTERYTQFKFFHSEILKKCQKEITENTPLSFTYTPIKKGRKVVGIRFEVEKNPQIEVTPDIAPEPESDILVSELNYVPDEQSAQLQNHSISESYGYDEYEEDEEEYLDGSEKYTNDKIAFLATACKYEFSELQMMEIAAIISNMDFIAIEYENSFGIDFARVHYLMEKYAKLNTYAEGKGLDTKRRFAYFRKMIINDKNEH